MNDDLAVAIGTYSVPTHPNVTVQILRTMSGRKIAYVTGGSRAERDDAKQWLNDCLRAGHRTPITFTDEDEMGVEPA